MTAPDDASSMEPPVDPDAVAVETAWPLEQMTGPTALANSFMIQVLTEGDGTPGDVILNVGFISPPPFLGTAEEQLEQAKFFAASGQRLTVNLLSRVAVSQQRLAELAEVITGTLERIEEAKR